MPEPSPEGSSVRQERFTTVVLGILIAVASMVVVRTHPDVDAGLDAPKREIVFLGQLIEETTWPSDRSYGPILVGHVGEGPVLRLLERSLGTQVVDGRPIDVRHIDVGSPSAFRDAQSCHVLFVGRDADDAARRLARRLHGQGVLTVGTCDSFASREGIVGLDATSRGLRVIVHLERARASGIGISPDALAHAELLADRPVGRRPR